MRKLALVIAIIALTPFVLNILGFRFVVLLTDSMEPRYPKWSLVVTCPTWLRKPRVGDVVLYRLRLANGEYLIMHRVLRVERNALVTKGDNRDFVDPWVAKLGMVVGVAVLCVPWLGCAAILARFAILPIAGYLTWICIYRLVAGNDEEILTLIIPAVRCSKFRR